MRDRSAAARRAVRGGDYGSPPLESSFAMHATVMRHYLDGAWYPVGGAAAFAREFGATITAAGGQVRTNAEVAAIQVEDDRAAGVRLSDGEVIAGPHVISDVGIHNTLRLLPSNAMDYRWAEDALGLEPSIGFVGLVVPLRAEASDEGLGMDVTQHGEEAYVDGEGAILVLPETIATVSPALASAPAGGRS